MLDTVRFDSAAVSEWYELSNRRNRFEYDAKVERTESESIAERDAADLARLGKKEVLKVWKEM